MFGSNYICFGGNFCDEVVGYVEHTVAGLLWLFLADERLKFLKYYKTVVGEN